MEYLLILIFFAVAVLFLPYEKTQFLKKPLAIFIISVIAAGSFIFVLSKVFETKEKIVITALDEKNEKAEGTEIWVKGIMSDGNWQEADEFFKNKGWEVRNNCDLGWRSFDQPDGMENNIEGMVSKFNDNFTVVFEGNKWHGKAKINYGNKEFIYDTYSEGEESIDSYFQVFDFEKTGFFDEYNNKAIVFLICFVFVFCLLWFLESKLSLKKENTVGTLSFENRETWADVLRVICVFTVVLLHYTCNAYNGYNGDIHSKQFYNYLYINVFTSFAVPCFFMLSGAFVIRNNENLNIKEFVKNKVLRLYLPLIAWSIVYIFLKKFVLHNDINIFKEVIKSFYSSQYYHLWFMYTILGLYIMVPIISFCYYKLPKNIKIYLGFIIIVLPSILLTFTNSTSPLFFLFPDIGVFMLGKVIYDNKEKIYGKTKVALITMIIGFGLGVIHSYYATVRAGEVRNLFGSYGSLPILIFAIGMFIFVLSLEPKLRNLSNKFKNGIFKVSLLSFGIYFVHLFAREILAKTVFDAGAESIFKMTFGAVICFAVSFVMCYVLYELNVTRWLVSVNKKKIVSNYFDGHKKDNHTKSIDGIRGTAAIIISIYHFELYYPLLSNGGIFNLGYLFVEMFFIISGFLLIRSIEKRIEIGKFSIKQFIKLKLLRIYPAYIVSIFGLAFIYSYWGQMGIGEWIYQHGKLKELFSEVFLIQTTGIADFQYISFNAWYVSVLFIVTIIILFLYKIFNKKFICGLSLIIFVTGYAMLFIANSNMSADTYIFSCIPTAIVRGMADIMLGVFTYYVYKKINTVLRKLSFFKISIIEIIIMLFIAYLMKDYITYRLNWSIVIVFSIMVLCMFSNSGIISKLLSIKYFSFLGKISYSYYLWQAFGFALVVIYFPDINKYIMLILYIFINIFIGWLSYLILEKGIFNLFRKNNY